MKKTALAVVAGAALGLVLSPALAKPTDTRNQKKRIPVAAKIHTESPQGDFFDDFESYEPGSDIVGQGGWELWYTGGETAEVSDDTANSGSNSLKDRAFSDIVQRFNAEDGQWTFSVYTYVPSTSSGDGYVIMMNQYENPTDNWSVQVRFNPDEGIVESQADFNTTTLIEDQWVELRCEIDLDADTLNIYYNGVLFAPDLVWSTNVSGNGITSIANCDLYSDGIDPMYYDDVSLRQAGGDQCYADCDADQTLTFFDFLCFTNAFNGGDDYSDCDGDGVLTFFDFLCFTNEFNGGC